MDEIGIFLLCAVHIQHVPTCLVAYTNSTMNDYAHNKRNIQYFMWKYLYLLDTCVAESTQERVSLDARCVFGMH